MRVISLATAVACTILASTPSEADDMPLAKPDAADETVAAMPKGDKQQVRVLTATIAPGQKTPFQHRYPVTIYVLEGHSPSTSMVRRRK